MIRNGSTKIGEERRTRLLRPLLCLATSTLFLSGTPLLHGAKIKRAPRKSAPIYGSTKRAKPAPPPTPFNPTLGTPPVKITGITLIVPDTEAEYPMFRITRPDGNSADSPFGHWSPLTPVAIEEVPLAPTVPSKTPPTPTISLSAAPEFRQTVPLFPGSYQVRFS
ncbi:MAG: hypothetical protein KY468_19595 [Armatimonadetes bacterium]|nr:hypothetical protein [Armatimonadota bacterium]